MKHQSEAAPRASLSVLDGIAIIIGVVIGIGIFKTPSLVAANVDSEWAFLGAWLLGGLITLCGALVYAELAAAYPSTGGEYRFLSKGLGRNVALLFAWARISVIQTGAIAAVAFVFGDYAQEVVPLGPAGTSLYALLVLTIMTAINMRGTRQGKTTQNLLSGLTFAVILIIVIVGLYAAGAAGTRPATAEGGGGALGLAMVFILLTYGGWNEAAYISADVRDAGRNMARVLVFGTCAIAAIYLVANLAYLSVLGLQGLRDSSAVAADMMQLAIGQAAAILLSLAICIAALSTLNGTIFTGARVYHAVGADLTALRALGSWNPTGNNPRYAILVQSTVALALVLFGSFQRDGFQAMVEYTAPVFWFFMLLVGVSYFVLRHRDAKTARPFKAPLYPLVPALFCLSCGYLLYASLAYTRLGALIGVAVLLVGVPVILLARRRDKLIPAE
jgi:APA family basic amino acid/polyamine antiporter